MAIQAPASWRYCPNFLFALERVASDDATGPIFARFHSPWLFLESPDDYASLFRSAGFEVQLSRFDLTQDLYTPDEVMRVFESGAAAGYFDARNYDAALPPGYTSECTSLLRSSFRDQASDDGLVSLEFNRIFLVARR